MDGASSACAAAVQSEDAVYDSGASSFLAGDVTFQSCVKKLEELGFPIDHIRVFKCHKRFRYGKNETGECSFAAVVPVFFGKKFGEILTYLIPGKTPFVFARPVAEELGLIIDHKQGLGKWHGDEEWFKLR